MALPMPTEQMERYKRTARAGWQAEKKQRDARRERAWQLARRAATLLKDSVSWSLGRSRTLTVLLYGRM